MMYAAGLSHPIKMFMVCLIEIVWHLVACKA